ncbi:unnamed protein product [Ilex paraguariensis]|uniref:C2H2-type domain-containing protein n=1 Tax=Ilex paraguariensis TaxID=185542 RepID=A0ABC8ULL0_9AQUA
MDRHRCKLCSKSFTSGKALGGHKRTHLATLPIPPKKLPPPQLGDSSESTSSPSSSSSEYKEEDERESEEKVLVYVLRENPKKSFRVVDPEFLDGWVIQDKKSETESKRNPTRRRYKWTQRMGVAEAENQELKKPKIRKHTSTESITELEPASSISETSPEEDVALCLMMLSRDVWNSDDSETEELELSHRTSQRKIKNCFEDHEAGETSEQPVIIIGSKNVGKKLHECPFCGKVFGSGQALGGHKRSHFLGSSPTASISAKLGESLADAKSAKFGHGLIDLNLPPSMEDDEDFCQARGLYCL